MSFWLYDPLSFKNAALFPTGGLGNFLNTLTIVLVAVIAAIKTRFQDFADNTTLMKYGTLALTVIIGSGLLFCSKEEENTDVSYDFDLTFE